MIEQNRPCMQESMCYALVTTYVMQEILQGFIIKILTTTTHAHVLSFFFAV